MRRILGALLAIVVVVAGCGGDSGGGGGGGGGGELPGGAIVIFGASYDPTSLGVTGKTTSVKTGSPVVAVGRAFTPRPPGGVTVKVSSGSRLLGPSPVSASNNPDDADIFAFDLTPLNLPAGTWQIEFFGANGRSIAAGFLTVTP